MKRYRCFLIFSIILFVGLAPSRALAQPLVLAGAVNKTAFVGDGSAKFEVVATGTPAPTYQWQTGTPGNFSNITDDATFSGSTTPTLTINISDLSLSGTEYRCKVTSNSVKVNSLVGTLTVYATPTETPTLTVTGTGVDGNSNPTIAANSTANITVTLSGVVAGGSIRVQRILDENSDGKIQVSEPVVQSFVVTDGQVTKIGGVTDPDIPGDDDGASDGNITMHLTLPTSPEGGRLVGTYLIKVSSPSGEFEPITKTLTVTQPGYGQTFSGQVSSGGSPVPYASVVALLSNGHDQEFVAGTVADANGNYTIAAPTGTYNVIGFASGYVQSFASAAQVTLTSGQNLTGEDLSLDAATCTVTSQVTGVGGSPNLRGVQFFVQSNNNGQVSIVHSNADGNLIAALTSASDWDFQISQDSTHTLGYLQPQNDPIVDTTSASSSNNTINETSGLQLTAGNALIYGTVEDSQNNPLMGVSLNDNDSGLQDQTTTDSTGNYYLLANGPASGPGDNWSVSPDDSSPALAGYVAPSGTNMEVLSGQAYPTNFVAQLVNAHFQGTVTNNGTPVVGVVIDAQPQNGGNSIQATTDSSGNFDLGVGGGNWNITLDSSSADSGNLVGPQLSETIADNQTISGIAYHVLSATATISGNVKDANGNPLSSNYNVSATTTISGVQYSADSNIDGSGNYSLPLINGTWTISVQGSSGPPPNFQDQTIIVTGSQTLNLGPLQPTAYFQGTVSNDGSGVAGVQIDAVLQNGNISFQATTDSNGNFNLGVVNGTWTISLDSNSTNQNNLVAPLLTETIADTQTISGIDYEVLSATAFVGGTAKDGSGNPLATSYSVNASANISGVQYDAVANLDSSGDYSLPLVNGTWTITVDSFNGPPSNYQPLILVVTGSQTLNLAPFVATAHFQGTVTNNGSPVSGIVVDATQQSGGAYIQATTDSNGNFDLGVVGGAWNINVDPNSVETNNLLVTTLGNETIADTQTVSGLAFDVLTATGTISGTVSDYSGAPVPNNASVFASTTINSVIYNSSTSTDGSGNYSLPVVNGEWTVQAGGSGLNFNSENVTVSGSATANLMASVITSQPADQSVVSGQSASFGLSTNTPGSFTLQWQVSTDGGSTWSNLSDDATYSNTANSPLEINATTALDGYEYECVVSFTYNSSPVSQTSTAATLTVTPANQPPSISVSPVNQEIIIGGNATFDITASGYPAPDVQWQVSTDGGNTWSNLTDGAGISGSSTSTLTLATPPLATSGYQYRAVASNSSGSPSTSDPATLLVGFSNNYLTWLNSSFDPSQLGNPAESALTATPAGDGIPNLVKYALGLPSLRSDQDELPQATSSGGVLSLSFSASQPDVTYTVQACTDLVNWSTQGVNVQVNAGVETATYSLSNGKTVFLRIIVAPNSGG